MNYRDVAKRLKKVGCQELSRRSGGSHRKWYNPTTERATVVPDWAVRISSQGQSGLWCVNWALIGRILNKSDVGSLSAFSL